MDVAQFCMKHVLQNCAAYSLLPVCGIPGKDGEKEKFVLNHMLYFCKKDVPAFLPMCYREAAVIFFKNQ